MGTAPWVVLWVGVCGGIGELGGGGGGGAEHGQD